jgi:MSHA biogenesis protein MshN
MSLINDMLKDLEKRHAAEAYPNGVVLAGLGWRSPAAQMRHAQWVLGLGGVLAVAIVVLVIKSGLSFSFHDDGMTNHVVPALPAPIAEPAPPAATAMASAPTNMIGLQTSESSNGTAPVAIPVQQDPTPAAVTTAADSADAGAHTGSVEHNVDPKGENLVAEVKPPATPGVQAVESGESAASPGSVSVSSPAGPPDRADGAAPAAVGVEPARLHKSIHPVSKKEQARMLRGEALRLAQEGDLDDAEEKLTEALSLEPRHVAARGALVGLMIQRGQLSQAVTLLDEGLSLRPKSATLIELRARIYLMQGEDDKARTMLEEHAPDITKNPDYHAILAAVYQRLGDYAKAGAVYQALVQQKPENGIWWLGLGLSMEATGKVDEARQAYEKAQLSRVLSPKLRQFVKEKLSSLS